MNPFVLSTMAMGGDPWAVYRNAFNYADGPFPGMTGPSVSPQLPPDPTIGMAMPNMPMPMPPGAQQQQMPPIPGPSPSDAEMWGRIMGGPEARAMSIVEKMDSERAAKLAEFTKEFEAKQAAERAEFLRTLDWNIEHGVAPHQVKGRSPEDVERARGAAREVDEYVAGIDPTQPQASGGRISGLYSKPGYSQPADVQEYYADKAERKRKDDNWASSKHIDNPEETVIAISPGNYEGSPPHQTLDGLRAARLRAVKNNPEYQRYLAEAISYLEKRNAGKDAVSPGPLRIYKPPIDDERELAIDGEKMKYGDYKATMADRRQDTKERNAADLAGRKMNVRAKSRGMDPIQLWAEEQITRGGMGGELAKSLSPDQQYMIDVRMYGPEVADKMRQERLALGESEKGRQHELTKTEMENKGRLEAAKVPAEIQVKGQKEIEEARAGYERKNIQLKDKLKNDPASPQVKAWMSQIEKNNREIAAIDEQRAAREKVLAGTAKEGEYIVAFGTEGADLAPGSPKRRASDLKLQQGEAELTAYKVRQAALDKIASGKGTDNDYIVGFGIEGNNANPRNVQQAKSLATATAMGNMPMPTKNTERVLNAAVRDLESSYIPAGQSAASASPFTNEDSGGESLPDSATEYSVQMLLAGFPPNRVKEGLKQYYSDKDPTGWFGDKALLDPTMEYAEALHKSGVKPESIPPIMQYVWKRRHSLWDRRDIQNMDGDKVIRDLLASGVSQEDATKAWNRIVRYWNNRPSRGAFNHDR